MPVPYWNPAATWGAGQRLWLPPWIEVAFDGPRNVTEQNPARASQALISNASSNLASQIRITIPDYLTEPATQAKALQWLEDIDAALSDKTFNLNIWSHSGFPDCVLENFRYSYGRRTFNALRDCEIVVKCPFPRPSRDYGIAWTDQADYLANYPFSSVVGLPLAGSLPGTSTNPEYAPMVHSYNGIVRGAQPTTPAGNEIVYTLPGSGSETYRIEGFKVTSAEAFVSTADATLELSDAGVGGAGQSIQLVLPTGDRKGPEAPGFFNVAGGSDLFVFLASGGSGHSDIQFSFRARPV